MTQILDGTMLSARTCRLAMHITVQRLARVRSGLLVAVIIIVFIAGCSRSDPQIDAGRAIPIQEAPAELNLEEILLRGGSDPLSASLLQTNLAAQPDDLTSLRQIAHHSLSYGDTDQAKDALRRVADHPRATEAEKLDFAAFLLRSGDVSGAENTLSRVPVKSQAAQFYLLKAVIADTKSDWASSDRFYRLSIDRGGTTPTLLNNWGYSNLRRGEFEIAERRFAAALRLGPDLFEAKANLATARASRKNYTLPPVPMSQHERAELLYTMALVALRGGDAGMGRALLIDAIETHPQYFEAATRSLEALESASGLPGAGG